MNKLRAPFRAPTKASAAAQPPVAAPAQNNASVDDQEAKRPRLSVGVRPAAVAAARPAPAHPVAPPAAPPPSPMGPALCFQVVWTKPSKKKHKTYEGDGFFVVRDKVGELLDSQGKSVSKGKLLGKDVKESSSFIFAGKEIEVLNAVDFAKYTSGQCFTKGANDGEESGGVLGGVSALRAPAPFKNPQSEPTKTVSGPPRESICKPRHDPAAPGAVVMLRPNRAHEREHNRNGRPVVDVVIDPLLVHSLRPHQIEGVKFLYECVMGLRSSGAMGAILGDSMGLGKTLQCITLIWTLLKQGPYGGKPQVKRVLIVCPSSLVSNWAKEFKKWLGIQRISVFPIVGESTVEQFSLTTTHPVMIISYEMFLRNLDAVYACGFDLLICDEAHRLKNSSTKTASAMMGITTKRRVALTGTPIQNDLQEFFAIVEFCNPGILGNGTTFRHVYEDPIVASRQPTATADERQVGQQRAQELSRMISTFCIRRTEEVNNKYLPAKTEFVVFCPPTPLQQEIYRELLRSIDQRTLLTSDASQYLACIMLLKKLCNTPMLLWTSSDDDEDKPPKAIKLPRANPFDKAFSVLDPSHSGKLNALIELLQQVRAQDEKEKVLVVSNSTKCLDVIAKACDQLKFKTVRLEGSTPSARRVQIVEQFNAPYSDTFVFLLSSKAGGVGLNITGANRLVLYDIDWNPANDLQAMARIWRDGQKRPVFIYRFLTSATIEEKIFQRQVAKQGISGLVVDHGKESAPSTEFSAEDLKDLFSYRPAMCDTHDLLECPCQTKSAPPSDDVETAAEALRARLKKAQSISQLLQWQHVAPAKQSEDIPDGVLSATAGKPGLVNFVFYSYTSPQQLDAAQPVLQAVAGQEEIDDSTAMEAADDLDQPAGEESEAFEDDD